MKNIFFLGCGKMGSVIANKLLQEKTALHSQIKVLKNSNKNQIPNIEYLKNISDLPESYQADIVFLAIKPQNSKKILETFSKSFFLHKNTIFISILAGKKVAFFEKVLPKNSKIVRSMPSLTIQYSKGLFAYLCNKNIKQKDLKVLNKLFSKFGSSFKIEKERSFDAITAIFGSGPAYIFLLQEIFLEIALSYNLKKSETKELVKNLFLGSSLMSKEYNSDFSELRQLVTSKKGTTEAALEVLKKKSALKNIFKKAITAAVKRSKELSND